MPTSERRALFGAVGELELSGSGGRAVVGAVGELELGHDALQPVIAVSEMMSAVPASRRQILASSLRSCISTLSLELRLARRAPRACDRGASCAPDCLRA